MGAVSARRGESWHAVLIWTLEPVLILSAWRLVAGGDAKLVMHGVPSFGLTWTWHEHSWKQSWTQRGTWQRAPRTQVCVLCSCVCGPYHFLSRQRPSTCTVESVLPVCVAPWACKSVKARWATWDGLPKRRRQSVHIILSEADVQLCVRVCVCILVCVHAPKRPSLSPPLPFPSSSSSLNINE